MSSMTMVDVAHLYETGEAVECGIARVVVRRITDDQIRELRTLVERADEARGVFDAERFLLDDLRIHPFVIGMMDNALLHDAADSLLLHNLRFWRSFFQSRLPQGDTMLSHRDLLAAFENRDGDAAEEATRAHIEGARQLLVTLFDGN